MQAEVLRRLYDEVRKGGEEGYAVFLAEKLPELLSIAVEAVKDVDIDRLVIMDGGGGGGTSNAVNQKVQSAYGTLEGLASTLGIDIQSVLAGVAARVTQLPVAEGNGQNKALEAVTADGDM